MDDLEIYQSFLDKYRKSTLVIKKISSAGMFVQIGLIGSISGWKHLGIKGYEIAAPILLSLSVYFFIKHFIALLRLEENMGQIILDGVEFEKKNPSEKRGFHSILRSFDFTKILMERCIINVLAVGGLAYFIRDILSPEIAISMWFMSLIVCISSAVICKLYSDTLKILDEAKDRIFSE